MLVPAPLGRSAIRQRWFLAAVMAAVVAVNVGLGALMAPGAGVATAEWWTSSGLAATGGAYVNLTVAALIPGLLGAALAVITRSSAISISIGAEYFVLGESLIGAFWAPLTDWGPSTSANVLALGGSTAGMMGGPVASMGYAKAAVLAGVYMTVSLLVTSTILAKWDVTS